MENQSGCCGSGVYRFHHLVKKDAVPYMGTGLTAFINDAVQTNISETAALNTINEWVEYPGGKIDKGTQLVNFRFMYMNMK
ncbi:hypothetical protein Phpb_03228 [Photorhabdus namnaonensis]|uniref:Uncharacterized protein n=1 Tax=Photorhabdus namnaonensis TaxID=1851568 RepID=A0A1B8YEX6_9GAMM|nr:hypothetical protein Phpb_03228 [Photorhabdus namnaonensis]